MTIIDIIDKSSKIDYGRYMQAMRIIARGFQTVGSTGGYGTWMHLNSLPQTKQVAWRLLKHQIWNMKRDHPEAEEYKSCPEYITNILY